MRSPVLTGHLRGCRLPVTTLSEVVPKPPDGWTFLAQSTPYIRSQQFEQFLVSMGTSCL